jgi:hypothetical protein
MMIFSKAAFERVVARVENAGTGIGFGNRSGGVALNRDALPTQTSWEAEWSKAVCRRVIAKASSVRPPSPGGIDDQPVHQVIWLMITYPLISSL